MMARRKKKSSRNSGNDIDSDLDYGSLFDGDEDFSSDDGPRLSYGDLESTGQFDDDDGFPAVWGDDEDDKSSLQSEEEAYKKKAKKVAIGLAIVIIIGFIIGIGVLSQGGSGGPAPTEEGNSRIEGDNEGVNITEQVGQTHTGSENGNPSNGTGAILAFDYQYYTQRSGEGARANFNPDASGYSAEFIQSAIDRVPGGTGYSLDITPMSIGQRYDVVLTLTIPGMEAVSYNQDFEVMEADGRFYVKSFTSRKAGS